MTENVVVVYGSGASYASGYMIKLNQIIDGRTLSKDINPPTDQNFFTTIPDCLLQIRYQALSYFKKIYYPPAHRKSMEEVWTDVDINHKHIRLGTYKWNSENAEYAHQFVGNYPLIDLKNTHIDDEGRFDTSLGYNRYKFLGDCGRDFRKLIYDIYANYTVPKEYDYLRSLHIALSNSRFKNISYLTFNYDCYLEQSLSDQGLKYIGLSDRTDNYDMLVYGGTPIIKLHGSLSWEESQSENIYKITYRAFPYSRTSQVEPKYEGGNYWYQPAIIPPTIFKQEINDDLRLNNDLTKTILQQWRAAITLLAAADLIIIVGYSFPLADHHVSRLFRISNMIRKRVGQKTTKLLMCCGPEDNLDDKIEIISGIYGKDSKPIGTTDFKILIESKEFKNIIS